MFFPLFWQKSNVRDKSPSSKVTQITTQSSASIDDWSSTTSLSADPQAFTGPLTSLRAVTSLPLSYPGIISLSKDCTTSLSTVSDIRQAQVTSRKGHFFWVSGLRLYQKRTIDGCPMHFLASMQRKLALNAGDLRLWYYPPRPNISSNTVPTPDLFFKFYWVLMINNNNMWHLYSTLFS